MDTIGDMLTKIRNAQVVKKDTVSFYYSKFKMEILKVLAKEKFIKNVDKKGKKVKTIEVVLAYDKDGNPAIRNIKRVSKLSKRVYVPFKKIKSTKNGFGVQIISTPKGVLTDKEAREEKVGGEVVCELW